MTTHYNYLFSFLPRVSTVIVVSTPGVDRYCCFYPGWRPLLLFLPRVSTVLAINDITRGRNENNRHDIYVLMTCHHFSISSEVETKKFWTKTCPKNFFRGVKKYLKTQWNIYFRNILCLTRIHIHGIWIQKIRRRFREGLFRQFVWWDLGRWEIRCQHGPTDELWTIFSLTSDFVITIFGKPNIQNVNYVTNSSITY